MTRVAICQSNYLPWKGYFDLIHDVDVFVFYDDVQYTKNDWRNRNKIKTPQGVQWLTIPVGNHCHCRICDVKLQDSYWQKQHWKTLVQRYGKALHFEVYREFLEDVYLRRQWASLSESTSILSSRLPMTIWASRHDSQIPHSFTVPVPDRFDSSACFKR